MARIDVKICGLTRPEDAHLAASAGASHIGAILVPESPRAVPVERARVIAEAVSLPLVVVVAGGTPEAIARQAERAGAAVIQLHGDESSGTVDALRSLGDWELWKAARVRTRDDVERAIADFGARVDLLLLDAWHPTLRGGTGRRFPWEEVRDAAEALEGQARLGVAGGLAPDNVAEAVAVLRPDLVDVGSGVEAAPGIKDPERVRTFVERARQAAALLASRTPPER